MDGSRGGQRGRVADARAQMAPLGVALLFGIVIIGTVSIVVFGGTALEQTQDRSQVQRAEHLLTLFDSRTAMVALGDSDTQTTLLTGSGTYHVNDSAGRVRLVHYDYGGPNSSDETLYDGRMGSLVYEVGDTEVAYQGGGVWRKNREGQARMISPPEFHFRQSTLTLPLIRITNNDSASGPIDARVDATVRSVPVYPNPSKTYSGSTEPYTNPLENGTLVLYVQSKYYEGWAEYFRTRTEAKVTTWENNQTVRANLISIGTRGQFPMPQDGNGIRVAGVEGNDHSLKTLNLTLRDPTDDSADFNNMEWSMFVDNGQQQFEFNLVKGDTINGTRYLKLTVYYSDNNGNTYQGWANNTAFVINEKDADNDGSPDEYWANIDMTNKTKQLKYSKVTSSGLTHFDNPSTLEEPGEWNTHTHSTTGEPKNFSVDDKTSIYNVTAHYLELVGDGQLTVDDKSGDRVDESRSVGNIDYPGAGDYIAYFHITRNDVEIEFQ